MNLALTEEEAAFRDEMRTFFTTKVPAEIREKNATGQELSKDDVVTTMYTAGTTGLPKGAMITRGMNFSNCVNLGFPAGIAKMPLNLTLLKSCDIAGVFWGAFTRKEPEVFADNMRELMGWAVDCSVRPHVSERAKLADAADVLRRMHDRQTTGKIVLVP